MEAVKALKTRKSIRMYKKNKVSRKTIKKILDCGRLAPTAMNVQPWEFVVVENKETLKKIADIMKHSQFFGDAPVCIFVFCKNTEYYLEDGSAATENILIAANAFNLGSCWIAGDKQGYAKNISEILKVPDNYNLVSIVSVGFQEGAAEHQPKRSLKEVIHWEHF